MGEVWQATDTQLNRQVAGVSWFIEGETLLTDSAYIGEKTPCFRGKWRARGDCTPFTVRGAVVPRVA